MQKSPGGEPERNWYTACIELVICITCERTACNLPPSLSLPLLFGLGVL